MVTVGSTRIVARIAVPPATPSDPPGPTGPDAPAGLVVYGRRTCGVCRRAEATVHRELRRTAPWRRPALTLVDVDEAGLADRYGVRVPVVVLDGVELSELELAPGVVRVALRDRAAGWGRAVPPRRG
jgi:glutaredoxin